MLIFCASLSLCAFIIAQKKGNKPDISKRHLLSEDDLFYEPPQKTPVSSAKPQKPSVVQKEEKRNDTWYATVGGSIVVFAILAVLMCGAGIVTVEDISNVVVTAIPVLGAAEIMQRIVWAYMNK